MNRWGWIAVSASLSLAAVLAIALVVVIATDEDADGGIAESGAAPVLQLGGESSEEAQACLAERGIELPAPGEPLSGDLDPEELRQALEECGVGAPSGGAPFQRFGPSG